MRLLLDTHALLWALGEWLAITPEDALATRALPWHHRDPFDRMLVAQSAQGLVVVTDDAAIRKYGVPVLWD